MKYLILIMLLAACKTTPIKPIEREPVPRERNYESRREREYQCVQVLIKLDVPPLEASTVCAKIYGDRKTA